MPNGFARRSIAFAQPMRDEVFAAASFYRRCQEGLADAVVTAEKALESCDLVLARAHNGSQPIARLPVELVQDVLDYATARPRSLRPRDVPYFLSVFHRWRSVALGYAKLWSTIYIGYSSSMTAIGFGTFLRPSQRSTKCLQQHIIRSQDTSIIARIVIDGTPEGSEEDCLSYAVYLLYQQAERFKELHIFVNGELVDMVLPLPKKLANVGVLDVRANNNYSDESLLLGDDSVLRPTYLHLAGCLSPCFCLINLERLGHLSLSNLQCDMGYLTDLSDLLEIAPLIRNLKMSLELTDNDEQPLPTFNGLPRVPSLEVLEVRNDLRVLEMVVFPSNLIHLQLPQSDFPFRRNELAHYVSVMDNLIQTSRDLQSLTVRWWPRYGANLRVTETPNVNTWFADKEKLIAVMTTPAAIMQAIPNTFKPTGTPALRYLVIGDGGAIPFNMIIPLVQKIESLLDVAPQLCAMLVFTNDAARKAALGASSNEHSLRFTTSSRIPSMVDVCRAHNSGDPDYLGAYYDARK